jgi:hypothetical protein
MNKIKYAISLILIILLFASMKSTAAYDRNLVLTDSADDVQYYDNGVFVENISYNNLDIREISCDQTDDEIEVQLTLAENGRFEKSELVYYGIILITTSPVGGYVIYYMGVDLSTIDPMFSGNVIVLTGEEGGSGLVDVTSSDTEDNVLNVKFDTQYDNERVIGISAGTEKVGENNSYYDEAPDNTGELGFLDISAGGIYEINASERVNFKGTLTEGNPGDYTWYWVLDDSLQTFESQNPSNTFNIPGEYTGMLYVYDDEGNYGSDSFIVTVLGSGGGNGGGNNNQPGFELIALIAAIAIALIILRKRR